MSEKIVQLNEEIIKGQIKELVRGSVEETLNELLEKEAESLTQAARYERRSPSAAAAVPPPPGGTHHPGTAAHTPSPASPATRQRTVRPPRSPAG